MTLLEDCCVPVQSPTETNLIRKLFVTWVEVCNCPHLLFRLSWNPIHIFWQCASLKRCVNDSEGSKKDEVTGLTNWQSFLTRKWLVIINRPFSLPLRSYGMVKLNVRDVRIWGKLKVCERDLRIVEDQVNFWSMAPFWPQDLYSKYVEFDVSWHGQSEKVHQTVLDVTHMGTWNCMWMSLSVGQISLDWSTICCCWIMGRKSR